MKTVENGSKEYAAMNEPGLSHLPADCLNLMGWRATAETNNNGHVDDVVECAFGKYWKYLGECKLHKGYQYHVDGCEQLLGYGTGREPRAFCMDFINATDAFKRMTKLRAEMDEKLPIKQKAAGADHSIRAPWEKELPIPKDATQRGVRLFRDCSPSARESDATTTVNAVISVAARLAASLGETVGASAILADAKLSARMRGEWAHVYAALLLLRPLIEASPPETTKNLSAVQAFRDTTTFTMLLQRLPDLARTERDVPQPKQSVLGVELTASELRADLLAGAAGSLGAKIAAAAARGIDPAILNASRSALPPPGTRGKGTGGRGGGGGSSTGQVRREPELVGDLGEAFVHEWLGSVLGADYGPDCWVSRSRERYGLPVGNDGLCFDFKVPDPKGLLFGHAAAAIHIEVKATSTDGSGPFPMSRAEWEEARRCHVDDDAAYVIVRVFKVDTAPRIGDVIFDPFAAHGRGEVRLADRDLWVTVALPHIAVDDEGDSDDGVAADDTTAAPAAARSVP